MNVPISDTLIDRLRDNLQKDLSYFAETIIISSSKELKKTHDTKQQLLEDLHNACINFLIP